MGHIYTKEHVFCRLYQKDQTLFAYYSVKDGKPVCTEVNICEQGSGCKECTACTSSVLTRLQALAQDEGKE